MSRHAFSVRRSVTLGRSFSRIAGSIFLIMTMPTSSWGGVPGDAECHKPDGCVSRSNSTSSSNPNAEQTDGNVAPGVFLDLGATFQSLESQGQREQSQRARKEIEQQIDKLNKTDSTQHCPRFVEANGQRHSVLDVINQYGQASKALVEAKIVLRKLHAQSECSALNGAQSCSEPIKLWEELVDALGCHASARIQLTSKQIASAQVVSEASSKDLLNMFDAPSAHKSSAMGNKNTSKSPGASGTQTRSGTTSTFPTPRCQFISDASFRHEVQRQVCVSSEVYECRDRSSNDPSMAWARIVAGGCGQIRSIEAVEKELYDLIQEKNSINGSD